MQFNDTVTKTGLIQRAEDYTLVGTAAISGDATLLQKFTNWINEANAIVTLAMMQTDRQWRFDDSNYSDFPIASITLVSGQRDYTLPASTVTGDPSSLYRINRVRILDTAGNYQVLTLLDRDSEESTASGLPTQYRLIGNAIRLSPRPVTGSVTITGGLEIQFQRGNDQFTVADTSQQPAFIDGYHYLLAMYAAWTYLIPFRPELAATYKNTFDADLVKLQEANADRNDEPARRIVAQVESNR